MPTFPRFDPSNLPPYPEKPHKTGQARVNLDGKSQYLAKYGTVESHALYHMACARKLATGLVPSTKELREELTHLVGGSQRSMKRSMTPSIMTMVGLLVLVGMTSSTLSHYLTKASARHMPSQQVVTHSTHMPIKPDNAIGEKTGVGDNQTPALNDATSKVVEETSAEFPDASISEALGFAAERFKTHSEWSQPNGKEVDARNEGN